MIPRSPEAKIAWIVLTMIVCFVAIFALLTRVPASFFNRFF